MMNKHRTHIMLYKIGQYQRKKLVKYVDLTQILIPIGLLIIGIVSVEADENISAVPPLSKFISRQSWRALPPRRHVPSLQIQPAPYVIIGNIPGRQCYDIFQCSQTAKLIQKNHLARGAADIKFNFLIGGDGNIYEGRGWGAQGAHTRNFDTNSIGIAFIGTFTRALPPTNFQVDAAQLFVEIGVRQNKISKNYKLLGQRQVALTVSPGKVLYNIIKTWRHWSPRP